MIVILSIELYLKRPNIFKALGAQHYELRHSNFLSWLLNPNENHGIGTIFLTKFLRDILTDDRSGRYFYNRFTFF